MAPGIIFLLAGIGILALSGGEPQTPPNTDPGDDNNSPQEDPQDDLTNPPPIENPLVVNTGDSEITIVPYQYHVPIPGVDYTPLPTDIPLTAIVGYNEMFTTMQAEAAQVGEGFYASIMYRTGWLLLTDFYHGEVLPSVWWIALMQAGFTPLSMWHQKIDAITALGVLLHGEASVKPPSVPGPSNASYLENFNWNNPPSNSNYEQVRNFLTGWTYSTMALRDACACGGDLDFLFKSQMTLQIGVIWRNNFYNLANSDANFNFPR